MLAALMELKLSHWNHSVYLIFDFQNCGDGHGDEKVRALNLTRHQSGAVNQPIPDEVLLEMDRGEFFIRHHNGGPVKWSSHRSCLCKLPFPVEEIQQILNSLSPTELCIESTSHPSTEAGGETTITSASNTIDTSLSSVVSSLYTFSMPTTTTTALPTPPDSDHDNSDASRTKCNGDEATVRRECHAAETLLVGKFSDVTSFLRSSVMRERLDGVSTGLDGSSSDEFETNALLRVPLYSFSGYAEWTRAQLLGEIARGSWGVMGAPEVFVEIRILYYAITMTTMIFHLALLFLIICAGIVTVW
jgi:hypothetical protein